MGAFVLLAAGAWLCLWFSIARWVERRGKRRGVFWLVLALGMLIPFMDLIPPTVVGWLKLRQLPTIAPEAPLQIKGVRTDPESPWSIATPYVELVTHSQVLDFVEVEHLGDGPRLSGVSVGPPGYYQFWRPQDPQFCPDVEGAGSNGHFLWAGECFRLTHSDEPMATLWLRRTEEPRLAWWPANNATVGCIRLSDLASGMDVARRCWCLVTGWLSVGPPSLTLGEPPKDGVQSLFKGRMSINDLD